MLSDHSLSVLSVTLMYCGQMIRMPLGIEVRFGPCHIVLDGNPAPHPTESGTAAPTLEIYGCRQASV